ncbi:hypothetical protein AMTRI_Chr05g72640 [Amborella trichopoda]
MYTLNKKIQHSQKRVNVASGEKKYNFKFEQERSRNDLAKMIILHEYPFSIVEHMGFRTSGSNLRPFFKKVSCGFKMVSKKLLFRPESNADFRP